MSDCDDKRTADIAEARRRMAILLGEAAPRARSPARAPAMPVATEIADPDYYAWRECLKGRRS